ncbi:MAG: arsenic efflux protein [Clostridiales bacterium]|nr:arsenic efflux protein [Clostridiales bacterium]
MGEVFLDAFLDTLWVLPFLLVMNFLIELVEYGTKGLKANRILKGPVAPLIGTAVGVVPQCGFSVVATELYSKRKIALGTLLAVYLATSDEALPIMLSSVTSAESFLKILPVLIIKVCFALVVGYLVFGVEKIMARKKSHGEPTQLQEVAHDDAAQQSEHEHRHEHEHDHDEDVDVHIHGCHHHALEEKDELSEGATKRQKAAHVWNVYLKHPLLHTATVILYIFIVNVIFGVIVYYVGEKRLAEFISSTGYLQPVLAALVGLVPNCAGSVVITEMYVVGGLNLGGTVAGLCVSAGIGYAVLAKQNRPIRNTVIIIAVMYVISVALGVCITAIGY